MAGNDRIQARRYHPELKQVRLLPGTPFYDRQKDMMKFLLAQDNGSMLYNFRKAAGLPILGAEPMTGWDAEECKLKGHTTGHYLSAVSLAYAASGDERFRAKAADVVSALAECQEAFAGSGRVKPGFLSAYDEEQFDLLEEFTKYPEIWAPYYTLDKIMAGLIDAYELTGNEQALSILDPLGCWIYDRLSRLTDEHRNRMWAMYIAGEYGGMIGTLVRLYRITGRKEHLEAAKLFENPALFDSMAEGVDVLDGMHANQHIPQIIGALELYAATGDRRYFDIAHSFEEIVTGHHCYAVGGTGEEERFRAADSECRFINDKTAESCASVNMLRLTSALYEYEPQARHQLMDYYELTLFNHIMMSCSHAPDGGTTYFLPLAPGSVKHYETEENSCCHGTGMESRFRYMRDIYSYEGEGEGGLLRVDLPVSSVLDGEEKVRIVFSDTGELTITADADMKRNLSVRIPAWAAGSFPEAMDGYVSCGRLSAGESVRLELPMDIRKADVPSDRTFFNLAYGPYLLAALSDSDDYIQPEPGNTCGDPLCGCCTTGAGKTLLKPLFKVDKEKYHVYFKNF